jgi:hypothetical protein
MPRPANVCYDMQGKWNENDKTCTIQDHGDGMYPSCYRNCAEKIFFDNLGSCYDFESLGNGQYRQRYRFSDVCAAQVDRFTSTCQGEGGICRTMERWKNAKGTFVGGGSAAVLLRADEDARECSRHTGKSNCESAFCAWNEHSELLECDPKVDDCASLCEAQGGQMGGKGCVISRCRPQPDKKNDPPSHE